MDIETETSIVVLTARLRVIDTALARLTAERLRVLARIDEVLNTDGTNGRISASAVAATSKCSPAQAAGEIVLARKLAVLPAVSEAFANGSVTTGQIGAVAAIASPGDETRALELAQHASSTVLEREAAARRKDLGELRQQAHAKRFVVFKPSDDKASMTMIGRGPWAETDLIKQQLEKLAAQLEKGAPAKSSFGSRMYDALVNLARGNNPAPTETAVARLAAATATPRLGEPRLNVRHASHTSRPVAVLDDEPSFEPGNEPSPFCDGHPIDNDPNSLDDFCPLSDDDQPNELTEYLNFDFENVSVSDFETTDRDREFHSEAPVRQNPSRDDHAQRLNSDVHAHPRNVDRSYAEHTDRSDADHADHADHAAHDYDIYPDADDDGVDRLNFDDPDELFPQTINPTVIVTRANTKIVVHYDARTGIINYQNGPPIDHARFIALLCDASLEVIHYNNGSPNGIITTQRTKTDRQARYLAHRDGPCRVPECLGIGYTHAHHLTPASVIPGRTETAGLINICNYHHNQHHDGELNITGNPEHTITFTWNSGQTARSGVRAQSNAAGRQRESPR